MHLNFPHHPEWEIDPNPKVNEILKQPFHFIGKGAQCYVFESKDGNYVVKLFRYNQPCVPQKVVDLFNACKMAYDNLKDETGLVYIHLNPTPMNLPILHCKDAVGRRYKFCLDQARFAVQKKAKSFRAVLVEAKKSPIEMERRINELISLLESRTKKGVMNTDPQLSRNFGFLESQAIEFDFGNYRLSCDLDRKQEVKKYTHRLRRWLKRNAPEWVAYLDIRVESLQ